MFVSLSHVTFAPTPLTLGVDLSQIALSYSNCLAKSSSAKAAPPRPPPPKPPIGKPKPPFFCVVRPTPALAPAPVIPVYPVISPVADVLVLAYLFLIVPSRIFCAFSPPPVCP